MNLRHVERRLRTELNRRGVEDSLCKTGPIIPGSGNNGHNFPDWYYEYLAWTGACAAQDGWQIICLKLQEYTSSELEAMGLEYMGRCLNFDEIARYLRMDVDVVKRKYFDGLREIARKMEIGY